MEYFIKIILVVSFCVISTHQQTCSSLQGQDIDLPNLASHNGQPASQCCNICSNTIGCRAFSWNSYQGGTCWLKAGTGPLISKGDTTAGILSGEFPSDFRVVAFSTAQNDVGHISFVNEANVWFPRTAAAYNFTFESTTNWNYLNDDFLSTVDVVLFLDTRTENANQRAAFERYMRNGGAWLGFHFAAFALTPSAYPQDWNWYHNDFIGAGQYEGNTWKPTPAVLQTEIRNHPTTRNLPATFRCSTNEWYKWQGNLVGNANIDILLSIHESSFPLGTGPNPWEIWHDGYYPVVWTNKNYKMIYMNMGHNDIDYANGNAPLSSTFESEDQNRLIIDSLLWLGGKIN